MVSDNWLTVSQAAEELGLSPARIRQFILNGRLKAWEVNPRLKMIEREELERFRKLPRLHGTPGHGPK